MKRVLLAVALGVAAAGCVAEVGDPSDDEALADLAADEEQEVEGAQQALAAAPYVLRIHTCDKEFATTTDPVQITTSYVGLMTFQGLALPIPTGAAVALPAAGQTRNAWKEFTLPANALPANMDLLTSLVLSKRGIDGWCVDRLEIKQGGWPRWRFSAYDSRPGWYILRRDTDVLWVDDDAPIAEIPTSSLRFSDDRIAGGTGYYQDTWLEVDTCSSAVNPNAGTNDGVSLVMFHDDTFMYRELNNPNNDREPGQTDVYMLDEAGIQDYGSITLTKTGTDAWCINRMRLYRRGTKIAERTTRTWIDSAPDTSNQLTWDINKTWDPSATIIGWSDLPLKRAPAAWTPVYEEVKVDVMSITGCAHDNFDVDVKVTSIGEAAFNGSMDVELRATGQEILRVCSGGPVVLCQEATVPFDASTTTTLPVKLVANESKTLTATLDVPLGNYIKDLRLTATARPSKGIWDTASVSYFGNPQPPNVTPVCF